jgi:hypothetical protein
VKDLRHASKVASVFRHPGNTVWHATCSFRHSRPTA